MPCVVHSYVLPALPWLTRPAQRWTRRLAAARRILLASDFDGTVSEIVAVPEAAVAVAGTQAALQRLAHDPRWAVALISGRGVADLRERCPLSGVWYLGSHGNETLAPAGHIIAADSAEPYPVALVPEARAALAPWPGTRLEIKPRSLALHFRQAPAAADKVARLAQDLARAHGLRVLTGKCVFELQAISERDKGAALAALRQNLACDLAVFLGDDQTDESVFSRGDPNLLGIHVGAPEGTRAEFWVAEPRAAVRWLRRLPVAIATQRGYSRYES